MIQELLQMFKNGKGGIESWTFHFNEGA